MKKIQVNNQNVLGTVSEEAIKALNPAAADAIEKLDKGTGAGNDFLGWVKLPGEMPEEMELKMQNFMWGKPKKCFHGNIKKRESGRMSSW